MRKEGSLEHAFRHHELDPMASRSRLRAGGVLEIGRSDRDGDRKGARALLHEADSSVRSFRPEDFEDTAHKVAIAALKLADPSNYPRHQLRLRPRPLHQLRRQDRGPYLLSRRPVQACNSLLRKAADEGAASGPIVITEPAERDLALTLDAFETALEEAYDKRAPNYLAEHAYRLSQSFSKFYAACPVLAAPTPDLRASRLRVSEATLKQLEQTLELLGIETAGTHVAAPNLPRALSLRQA